MQAFFLAIYMSRMRGGGGGVGVEAQNSEVGGNIAIFWTTNTNIGERASITDSLAIWTCEKSCEGGACLLDGPAEVSFW